jgi:hypothetical protein
MSATSPQNVEIACPRCKVRILVPSTAAGTPRQCPECRTDFLITQKMLGPSPATSNDALEDDGLQIDDSPPSVDEGYALASPSPSPHLETTRIFSRDVEPEEAEAPAATWAPKLPPPPGLFVSGLLTFFQNGEIWIRGIPLGGGVFVTIWLFGFGLQLGRVPNLGMASFAPWFGSLVLCCSAGLLGIILLITISAYAVTVIRDMADGLDTVESWPPGFVVDWGQEMFYVGSALMWGLLPGALASIVLPPAPSAMIYGISEAVFFPIALLAALDIAMPMLPISPAVWKSPFRHPVVWLTFYVLSIPLFVLIAEILVLAVSMASSLLCLLTGVLFVPGWMLYFRLLGRLAWYCSGRYEQKQSEELQ